MKKNLLGNTGVEITEIAFGAWAIGGWMWGGTDQKEAVQAIHTALDQGMTSIDTAPIYGYGLSEELVGKAINGIRDEVQLLTKYGLRWDTDQGEFYFESTFHDGSPSRIHRYAGKESIIQECEDSLRRLKTDYIDLYQIHWPDSTTPIDESMEAVQQLLKQGKIRAAGVCNYDKEQLDQARQSVDIVTDQVPYSMVKRDIENELIPYCLEHDTGIVAYSPLQRGVLTGKITSDYTFGEGDHRPKTTYFQEPNLSRINAFLDEIKPIADAHSATLAQLVLQWTLRQPAVVCVLAGARNPRQVKDNVKGATLSLSDDEINEINEKLNELELERKS